MVTVPIYYICGRNGGLLRATPAAAREFLDIAATRPEVVEGCLLIQFDLPWECYSKSFGLVKSKPADPPGLFS